MVLKKQKVQVPLTGSIDEQASDIVQQVGQNRELENVELEKTGRLQKRTGYKVIGTAPKSVTGTSILSNGVADTVAMYAGGRFYDGNETSVREGIEEPIYRLKADTEKAVYDYDTGTADQSYASALDYGHYGSMAIGGSTYAYLIDDRTVKIHSLANNALLHSVVLSVTSLNSRLRTALKAVVTSDDTTFYIFSLVGSENLTDYNRPLTTYFIKEDGTYTSDSQSTRVGSGATDKHDLTLGGDEEYYTSAPVSSAGSNAYAAYFSVGTYDTVLEKWTQGYSKLVIYRYSGGTWSEVAFDHTSASHSCIYDVYVSADDRVYYALYLRSIGATRGNMGVKLRYDDGYGSTIDPSACSYIIYKQLIGSPTIETNFTPTASSQYDNRGVTPSLEHNFIVDSDGDLIYYLRRKTLAGTNAADAGLGSRVMTVPKQIGDRYYYIGFTNTYYHLSSFKKALSGGVYKPDDVVDHSFLTYVHPHHSAPGRFTPVYLTPHSGDALYNFDGIVYPNRLECVNVEIREKGGKYYTHIPVISSDGPVIKPVYFEPVSDFKRSALKGYPYGDELFLGNPKIYHKSKNGNVSSVMPRVELAMLHLDRDSSSSSSSTYLVAGHQYQLTVVPIITIGSTRIRCQPFTSPTHTYASGGLLKPEIGVMSLPPKGKVTYLRYLTDITDNVTYRLESSSSTATIIYTYPGVEVASYYTQFGNQEPNIPIGPINSICVYRNRLIAASDGSVFYSKKFLPGTTPEFSDAFRFDVGTENTEIVGCESMGDKLVVFSEDNAWVVQGEGFNDNFTGQNMVVTYEFGRGKGCIAPKSIISVPGMGLFWQSRDSIEMLDEKQLKPVDIGQQIEDTIAGMTCLNAAYIEERDEVLFMFENDAGTSRVLATLHLAEAAWSINTLGGDAPLLGGAGVTTTDMVYADVSQPYWGDTKPDLHYYLRTNTGDHLRPAPTSAIAIPSKEEFEMEFLFVNDETLNPTSTFTVSGTRFTDGIVNSFLISDLTLQRNITSFSISTSGNINGRSWLGEGPSGITMPNVSLTSYEMYQISVRFKLIYSAPTTAAIDIQYYLNGDFVGSYLSTDTSVLAASGATTIDGSLSASSNIVWNNNLVGLVAFRIGDPLMQAAYESGGVDATRARAAAIAGAMKFEESPTSYAVYDARASSTLSPHSGTGDLVLVSGDDVSTEIYTNSTYDVGNFSGTDDGSISGDIGTSFMYRTTDLYRDGLIGTKYPMKVTTAWLQFDPFQGYQRIYEFLLTGRRFSPSRITATFRYDFDSTNEDVIVMEDIDVQAATNPSGVMQLALRCPRQKCSAMQLTLLVEDVGEDADSGRCLEMDDLQALIGVKGGMKRVSAERKK